MFDEAAERAKLEVLDLTEDVIDMIIKKKRATYESKNAIVVPVEPIKEPIEPTYYPCDSAMLNVKRTDPPIVEPLSVPSDSAMLNVHRTEIPIPVLPEPTMERTLEPIVIVKRGLPWQRRK